MTLPHAFDDVLDRVADGAHVDWEALQQRAGSPEESAMLRNLRILAQLGDTHRAEPEGATHDGEEESAQTIATTDQGTQWGRYRLIRILGQGSFGTVYLARDEQLDREVAIKLLRPDLVAREEVKSEGRALARVDHTNVLTVYGVEEHGGRLALCMKYVRGRTLEDIIRTDGPMNADEALVVAKAMCNAVAAVHAAGVLHRDIKARNVMRERNGRYILMDFGAGVMQRADGSSGAEATIGTPLYMAPELFEGQPASRSTDVYALGVLLYFLVSGEYPVWGATIDELKAAHRHQRRTRLDDRRLDLPETYVRVVDRATSRNVEERPESATALLRELLASADAGDGTFAGRTVAQRVAVAAAALIGAVVGVTALGFINSAEFNVMLERSDVASESIIDWLIWGVRALIGPLFNLAQVLIALLLLAIAIRLVRRLLPAADRAWRWTAAYLADVRRRLRLDSPESFAQLVLVAGVAYLAFVCWSQADVITAFFTPISRLTPEQLAIFAPSDSVAGYSFSPRSVLYRNLFDYAVFGTGWGLIYLWRLRRTAVPRGNPAYIAAVAALFVLATILWDAPYRVMFQSQRPRVAYAGLRCYHLGDTAADLLVYCPDGAQPKVRRVAAQDPQLKNTGITESVFTTP